MTEHDTPSTAHTEAEYMPTMEEVRAVWCAFSEYGGLADRPHSGLWENRLAEFDHWLADHDELKRAEVLAQVREGLEALPHLSADEGSSWDVIEVDDALAVVDRLEGKP